MAGANQFSINDFAMPNLMLIQQLQDYKLIVGKNHEINHLVEMEVIVEALNTLAARFRVVYRHEGWMDELRNLVNDVTNLQVLTAANNHAKNQAINQWLQTRHVTVPPPIALEYFVNQADGTVSEWMHQMGQGWAILRLQLRQSTFIRLANVINTMLYGEVDRR